MNILVVNSHPIQYFSPLYSHLAEDAHIKLKVYYCSDESVRGEIDKQFGVKVKWDIPLLDGYSYEFLKNHSFFPSIKNGFWGLINLSVIKVLWQSPKSWIIVPGWQYFTYVLVIVVGRLMGHQICLRTETPLAQEIQKKGLIVALRKFIMKNCLFPLTSKFLYIGNENKAFYEKNGIGKNKLIFTPYSVDNYRFNSFFKEHKHKKNEIRLEMGIPEEKIIILVSGKYIPKKKPLDVLKAFKMLNKKNATLLMVGDGNLRPEMEAFILNNKLENVFLTGFVNQSKIPFYYLCADVFLMYSEIGETWGLAVNEAMNFNLPIVVSKITGCSSDLVAQGENGFIVESVEELSEKLSLLVENPFIREKMGKASGEIIQHYSYDQISKNLIENLS